MTSGSSLATEQETVVGNADPILQPGGRYIVGVDGSAASRVAVAWAAARAASMRDVHLLGVVDDDAGSMGREFADAGTRTLAGLLSRLADDTTVEFPGARITTGVTEGMVASALASAAGPHDVLVIGSDKTGYARGRLFGLRAAQLAAASAVTVAIVPSVDLRLRTGVVVAVPDAQTGADLARIGAREAVRRGCPLTLVHATGSAGHAASSNQVLTAARRAAQGACPDLEISALIPQRHPAEAILNVSRNKALLVVGRSRTTSPLGIGTTLHEVLMNANAPTIVISADEPGTILGS